jgi:hypothetical protein
VVGSIWVAAAVVCATLGQGSLLASHPAYAVTLISVCVVGLLLFVTGRQEVPAGGRRYGAGTVVGRVAGALVPSSCSAPIWVR